MRQCSFLSNKAGGNGGAIFAPDLHFENTTFWGNKAGKNGGAVYYSSLTHNQVRAYYCTFTSNEALGLSGAIHTPTSNLSITLYNSILTGNKSGNQANDANFECFVSMYNCIYGDIKYYVQISNIVESVKATAKEVFGTDLPEADENGVVKIMYDSPADCKGTYEPWLNIDQLGNRRYAGYVSIGAWQLFHEGADLSNQPAQMDNVTVTGLANSILIQADRPSSIDIFTLSGQLYLRTYIQSGQKLLSVPAGFYVVRVNERGWKVVVRK
jgi:predicted outer membrane repeat protein